MKFKRYFATGNYPEWVNEFLATGVEVKFVATINGGEDESPQLLIFYEETGAWKMEAVDYDE